MLGSESQEIAPDTLEDIQAMDPALIDATDGQPIIEKKLDFTTQTDDASDPTAPLQDQLSEYRERQKDAYEKQKQQETIAATEEKIKIFNEKLAQYKALRFCGDFSSADEEELNKVFTPEDIDDFVTRSQRDACDIATVSYFLEGENNEYGGLKEFLKKHIQCKDELWTCIEGLPNAESIKQQMLNLLEPFEFVIQSTIGNLCAYNENASRSKDLSYPRYQEIITDIELLLLLHEEIADELVTSANPNTSIANQRLVQVNNTNEVNFQDLPSEISTEILSYLTDVELLNLTPVSTKTQGLANVVLLRNSTRAKDSAYTFWLTLLRNPSETALLSYANEFYGLKNFTKKNLKKFFSRTQDSRVSIGYEILKEYLQEVIALVKTLHKEHPGLVLLFLNDQLDDSSYLNQVNLTLFNSALCQLIPQAKQIEQQIDAEILEIIYRHEMTSATGVPFVSERFAHYHSIEAVLTMSAFSTRLDKDILFSFIHQSFKQTFISDFFSKPEYHVQLSKFNAKDILDLLYNLYSPRFKEDRLDKILAGIDAENPVLIEKFTPELIQALAMLSRKSYQEIVARDALWTKLTIEQMETIETFIEEIEEYHSSLIQPLLKKCDEIDKLYSDCVGYEEAYRNCNANKWPSLDKQCIFMLDTCQQLAVLKDAVEEHWKATENAVVTLSFLETSENNINNNNAPSESGLVEIVISRAIKSVQNKEKDHCELFASKYNYVIDKIRSFFVKEGKLCAITSGLANARILARHGLDIKTALKTLKPISDTLNGLSKALMPILGEASRPLLERQLMTEILLPEIKELKETITSLLHKEIEAFKKRCEDYKARQSDNQEWDLSSAYFTFSHLNQLMNSHVQLSQTIDEALTLFSTTLELSELTTCNAALAEGRNALASQASDAIKQYLEWFVPQQDCTLSQAEKFYGDAMTALSSAENTLISVIPSYKESITAMLSKKKAEWDSFMTRMQALSQPVTPPQQPSAQSQLKNTRVNDDEEDNVTSNTVISDKPKPESTVHYNDSSPSCELVRELGTLQESEQTARYTEVNDNGANNTTSNTAILDKPKQENHDSSSSYKLVLELGILSELQQEGEQKAHYTDQALRQAANLYQSYYDDEIRSAMKTQYKLHIVITVLLSFLFTPISLCFTLPWTRRCKQEIDRIENALSKLKTLEKSFPAQPLVTTTSPVTEDDSTSSFDTFGMRLLFPQDNSGQTSKATPLPSLEISENSTLPTQQHLTVLRA